MSRRSDREREADASDRLASAVERLERTMRREPERIGSRSDLRRLPFDVYAGGIPGLASQFKVRVPAAFWAVEVRKGKERPVAVVSCPCQKEPAVEAGAVQTCDCGRAYVYDGGHVHVAFSPKSADSAEA